MAAENLINIWINYDITRFIIRNEALEEDHTYALDNAGIPLSDTDRRMIQDGRNRISNTSSRGKTEDYYNNETG